MEPTTSKPISRRSALIAAGLGVASLASTSLTGCALTEGLQNQIAGGSQSQKEWDGSSYLPIESVVKLAEYEGSDVKHAVITRRPYLSEIYAKDSSGQFTDKEPDQIYDYALVPWPIGVISDLNKIYRGVVLANSADITEVVFVGYEDDLEKETQAALADGRASGLTNSQCVEDIATKMLLSIPGVENQ